MGAEAVGEIPSLTGEFIGETHRVLEHTQNHPPGNQHEKGPICLWVVEEVTESLPRAEKWHFSLSDHFPIDRPQCSNMGCPALANT